MRLRTNLLYLITGTTVPLLLLASILGLLLVQRERDAFRQGAINRNRAFMAAVDAALKGHVAILQTLAADPNLESKDIDGFRQHSVRALKAQPDWQNLILSKPDGTQLVNAVYPRGEPKTSDEDSFQRVVATGTPTIGDVIYRDYSHKFGIAVRAPVIQNGQVEYVITAIVDPHQFERLIRDQHLPDGWVSGLVDASGHYIARVPWRPNSDLASATYLSAVQNSGEGWYRGLTVEGRDTFTAHKTSDFCNWSVGLGIPRKEVLAGATRAAWVMAGGTLITVAIALSFAYWMMRRISTPISSLAITARAMGHEPQPTAIPGEKSIDEVRELAQALTEANDAIRERQNLSKREQTALRAADRAKDEFLAVLSHELRNPLAAITTSIDLLRESNGDSNIAQMAHEVIERQTKQMSRLVEDLLNVSRLTKGKVTLQIEPFDLAQLSLGVIDTWEHSGRIEPGRISLESKSVWIKADRARVEQVLSNLIDNSVKFSPPNKPIKVRVEPEGETAVMEVSDQGEGIAPDLQGRLFGVFVQGPLGPDRSRGGLGLGLALVKQIVEMHGGLITVASDGPGHGATFAIRFPAIEKQTNDGRPARHKRGLTKPQRILVVEDNEDAREMLKTMLNIEGHEVRVAAHGKDALDQLRQAPADVVLLDIGLPDIDGYEIARLMRSLEGGDRLKIVALTGYGQTEDQSRAYEAGFDLHLTKPVPLDRIRELLVEFAKNNGSTEEL